MLLKEEEKKVMLYLMMHSVYFIYCHFALDIW